MTIITGRMTERVATRCGDKCGRVVGQSNFGIKVLLGIVCGLVITGIGLMIYYVARGNTVATDCSNDGFRGLEIADPKNRTLKRYTKFMFTKGDDSPFTEDKARAKCQELAAQMLHVNDINELLHVKTLPEAQDKAFWLENNNRTAQHSKVIITNLSDRCFYVPAKVNSGQRVMERTSCDGDFWALCVKKGCKNPKGDAKPTFVLLDHLSPH